MECPHLKSITKINNPFIKEGLVLTNVECSVCHSHRNPLMCIHCGILNCGSFVNGHAVEHFQLKKHHIISIDCNELSIYCYVCNGFVVNQKCYKYFQKLRHILQTNNKLKKLKEPAVITNSNNNKKLYKRTSGLRNLGNTCFMNAVLQSLCNIQEFNYYFKQLNKSEILDETDLTVTKELRKTIILLNEGSKAAISPEPLFTVIWKIVPRFRGYQQQDAHEFLRYMLDRLHTELLNFKQNNEQNHYFNLHKNNNSKSTIVTSIFGGILQNEVRCLICGTESKKLDPFFDLSLDIPQTNGSKNRYNLTDCLSKFTELEELEDTELYNCPSCKQKQRSTKKFWIRRLPNVLCLHLKRFKWNEYNRSKLDVHINFPMRDLDMSNFILSNVHETRNNNCGSPMYDLAAVIVHHGSGIGSGHYTSYATHQGTWHHFNDSSVNPCNEQIVLQSKAYILFYIRRDPTIKPFYHQVLSPHID